jgi:hypothetical protein
MHIGPFICFGNLRQDGLLAIDLPEGGDANLRGYFFAPARYLQVLTVLPGQGNKWEDCQHLRRHLLGLGHQRKSQIQHT